MQLQLQVQYLFLISIPIACIAWTVTHEEIFKEPRDYCKKKSENSKNIVVKKFFYLFTCEYCFSHYVTLAFLIITKLHLGFDDWRGYLISGFSLVWVANLYMNVFAILRIYSKNEKIDADIKEVELKEVKEQKTF